VRPLRVAYLPPALVSRGAERQMLALAEGLPRDRFTVDILAMSGAGPNDGRALAAGAHVRYLGSPPRPGASYLERTRSRGAKAARYVAAARAGRYDVVDAWLYPVDVMAALARPLTATPVVVTGRYNLRDFAPPMNRIERLLNDVANRMADAVVANSSAVAADARRHESIEAAKLRVIRNGVEPIDPLPRAAAASLRRSLGADEGDVLIGSVASLTTVKRHDLLIDAFAHLVRDGLPVRLVLLGDGSLREALAQRVEGLGLGDRVRLHGSVSDPRPYQAIFDIIVQASRTEGLPNALLEASAAARPIVATDAGGTNEIVVDGSTGILVPVNDEAALAAGMRRLVEDAALRETFGRAGRQRTDALFPMSGFIAAYATLYEELAAAKGLRRATQPAGAERGG
jgi:glycosyltransferase involved in cell wall biosynthesis